MKWYHKAILGQTHYYITYYLISLHAPVLYGLVSVWWADIRAPGRVGECSTADQHWESELPGSNIRVAC